MGPGAVERTAETVLPIAAGAASERGLGVAVVVHRVHALQNLYVVPGAFEVHAMPAVLRRPVEFTES